jgi:hypothetical protein
MAQGDLAPRVRGELERVERHPLDPPVGRSLRDGRDVE